MAGKRKNFVIWSPEFGEFEVVTIQAIVEGVKGKVDYVRKNAVIEKRE